MPKVSSIKQANVAKTKLSSKPSKTNNANRTLKLSENNEMARSKRECKTSLSLLQDKENTPPVFTRSKSRTYKPVNNINMESTPLFKTKKPEKINEVKGNSSRTALTPVKQKPVAKCTKNRQKTLNVSPIHGQKCVPDSGRNGTPPTLLAEETIEGELASDTLLPFEEMKDGSLASVSHTLFRRRSSKTIKKETCMLTSENPSLEYWKMLAEQRLAATDITLRQNEVMYDQLHVLQVENSQLKELLEEGKNMITILQRL